MRKYERKEQKNTKKMKNKEETEDGNTSSHLLLRNDLFSIMYPSTQNKL